MLFVGIDWSEKHDDYCIVDEAGEVLGLGRVPSGLDGVSRLHAAIAEHAGESEEIVVALETDRGLLVRALVAAGYEVFAVNPLSVSRYRERHSTSGAKSDPGDAKVLADLVRTDRHNHRNIAGDSELAEAVKLLARAHKEFIWDRQNHVNYLRNLLREFYPQALVAFGTDLASSDAVAVLTVAPTPELGKKLSRSKIAAALKRGGRQRNIEIKAVQIQDALRSEQLFAPPRISQASGFLVTSTTELIEGLNRNILRLEGKLEEHFEEHPDAEIIRSLPGLGVILGARVLAEFGDDPNRYEDAKARRNYAGTSPITRASGTRRVVLARFARNRRLFDACYLWAFSAISRSPGARRYYDSQRARGKTHSQALRAVANRMVGILHGCITNRELYLEDKAWPVSVPVAA